MDYPFDTVGLTGETIDSFYETYTALKARFNIELTGHIDFHLENFEVFRQYKETNLRDSYVIKQAGNDCYILFIEARYKHKDPTSKRITYSYEYQTWALAYLKQDFGRVMIRPETLADKILELIHPIELDFAEDK